jgi:hypothetical protein
LLRRTRLAVISPAPVESATHYGGATPLHFELDGVGGGLQEMDVAVVGGDDEVAVGPLRIFVSADQEFEGEMFENEIASGLEIVAGKRRNGSMGGAVQSLSLATK